jgi:hypothetical protein
VAGEEKIKRLERALRKLEQRLDELTRLPKRSCDEEVVSAARRVG